MKRMFRLCGLLCIFFSGSCSAVEQQKEPESKFSVRVKAFIVIMAKQAMLAKKSMIYIASGVVYVSNSTLKAGLYIFLLGMRVGFRMVTGLCIDIPKAIIRRAVKILFFAYGGWVFLVAIDVANGLVRLLGIRAKRSIIA